MGESTLRQDGLDGRGAQLSRQRHGTDAAPRRDGRELQTTSNRTFWLRRFTTVSGDKVGGLMTCLRVFSLERSTRRL